jgi:hypothetical protein
MYNKPIMRAAWTIFAVTLSLVIALCAVAATSRAAEQQRNADGACYGYAVPSIDCVSPDWTGVVPRWGLLHVPAAKRGSDVQCYSAINGRPFVQRMDDPAGPYWTAYAHGRDVTVAAYDRVNHDFINMTHRSVVCASWAD